MEPDIGFAVVDREQGSEGWQIFIVDVDVFADGDMAFMELRFLPSTVTGPLLLLPLRRAVSARFCFCSSVRIFFMTVAP
jgi:hypothetical protein